MYKKVTVNKEVTETLRYCDICGALIARGLACSVAQCEYCKKDLCDKCVGHEGYSSGDYRVVYCKECWDIGETHRETIEYLEKLIERSYGEWQKECDDNNGKKGEI